MSKKREDVNFLLDLMATELSQEQLDECKKFASTIDKKCYDLITSDDWKVDKVTTRGDTITSKTSKKSIGKIFKFTGKFDTDAETLIDFLYYEVESNDSDSWNKTRGGVKVTHKITDCTDLTYTETSPLAGGAISPRDYIDIRHRGQYERYIIVGYAAPSFELVPSRMHFVRAENGTNCYAAKNLTENKCELTWIIDTQFNGRIPQKLIDAFMPVGVAEFVESLRSQLVKK